MFLLQESGETVLHHCVRTADHTSLHLVDFLVQNRYQTLLTVELPTNSHIHADAVLMHVCVY